tara:strand:+ start:600 stop:1043 length:444 start_codon:yes stop_codon:yes gene_type:complete
MAIYQTGKFDSQRTNSASRSSRIYSDLDLNFALTPGKKDVSKKKDIEAVKQSVRNLILTNHYERPFHPEIGSSVRSLLFENINPITTNILKRAIGEVITNFEPRARLSAIDCFPDIDRNGYEVTIHFYIVNMPGEQVQLETFLERAR